MNRLGSAHGTALLVLLVAAGPLAADGLAVEGRDSARILPPRGAAVSSYQNFGYRLEARRDEIFVEVDASALHSTVRFSPPRGADTSGDPVARLARAVTAGATTQYDAVIRIHAWVSRHVEYRLDRSQPQTAEAVLARRSGYCTGVARLTVSLLEAVGITAREVAGYVLDDGSQDATVSGYHRWIEVLLPDRGWIMSDPMTTHLYVPATYIRLASEALQLGEGLEGLLIERDHRLEVVDVYPAGGTGVTVRRNEPFQLAAALDVRTEGGESGFAVLQGMGMRYRRPLAHGRAVFVGLDPGAYHLRLLLPGGDIAYAMTFADRIRSTLRVPTRRRFTEMEN